MDLRFSPEDEQYRQKLRAWLEANVPKERPPKDQDAEFAYRRAWQRQLYAGGLVGINHRPVGVIDHDCHGHGVK